MDKEMVIMWLTALPGEIEDRENDVLDAQEKLNQVKEALSDKEAELLAAGSIDGKNAEARAAQMHALTVKERSAITEADKDLAADRINLNRAVNQFKAYRAVARLLDQGVA